MNLTGDSFQYDAFGRRFAKTILSTTTNYVYDNVNPVQELSSGTPTANLLTGGVDEDFTRTDATGTANFLADALAIRAAKFELKPTLTFVQRKNTATKFQRREKQGAIEGPIRIPLHSLLFLFNALAFLSISSKSLKFRSVLFSIPTAPTNLTD